MAENFNIVDEVYLVTFTGKNKSGQPYCRAQKIIHLNRSKNSEYPMDFLSTNDTYTCDGDYEIGSRLIVSKSVSLSV